MRYRDKVLRLAIGVAASLLVFGPRAEASVIVSSTDANGTYGIGAEITITVTSLDTQMVTGTPELLLNSGGIAVFSSVSGINNAELIFEYTVAAGQNANPLDEASTTALILNGGTITDAVTHAVGAPNLPAPGTTGSLGANKDIVIDTTTAVPEPASLTLLGAALLGFGVVRRRTTRYRLPMAGA